MKLISRVSGHRALLYFSSEQRVDFRAYVRDWRESSRQDKIRQIGVRDEAKISEDSVPADSPATAATGSASSRRYASRW